MKDYRLIEDITTLSFDGVRKLVVENIGERIMSEAEIDYFLRAYYVHWVHDGTAEEPHALLVSGFHSGDYYDCTFVLQKANAAKIIVQQLALRLNNSLKESDWVIGPSYGATFLISHMASYFNCFHAMTEKEGMESQVWRRFEIPEGNGAVIQLMEDVVTTGGSSFRTMDAIKLGNPSVINFYPRILTIINRSGKEKIGDIEIIGLLKPTVSKYQPDDCPLCKLGSKVEKIKPYLVKKYGKLVCN